MDWRECHCALSLGFGMVFCRRNFGQALEGSLTPGKTPRTPTRRSGSKVSDFTSTETTAEFFQVNRYMLERKRLLRNTVTIWTVRSLVSKPSEVACRLANAWLRPCTYDSIVWTSAAIGLLCTTLSARGFIVFAA